MDEDIDNPLATVSDILKRHEAWKHTRVRTLHLLMMVCFIQICSYFFCSSTGRSQERVSGNQGDAMDSQVRPCENYCWYSKRWACMATHFDLTRPCLRNDLNWSKRWHKSWNSTISSRKRQMWVPFWWFPCDFNESKTHLRFLSSSSTNWNQKDYKEKNPLCIITLHAASNQAQQVWPPRMT